MKIYKSTYGGAYPKMKKKFLKAENPTPIVLAARRIRSGSNVLEFGCSSGNLTRYLKEEKNCKVSLLSHKLS